jgi:hypothetical protein
MANNAPQIQYRQEYIKLFEQRQSLLRMTVTTESVIKGNQAVFLVAGSGHATATTRGVNGLIVPRADSNVQNTATLVEWHDLVRKTGFNVFESQGDQRKIMQESSLGVLNRKIDQDILSGLSSATQTTGTTQTASLALVARAKTILGNQEVPQDGNISAVISPAFHNYLIQCKEFTNVNYINDKPFANMPIMFRWAGVNWIEHPNIVGKGTNAEQCYMYHKDAIGHAANVGDIDTKIGYMEEQDYSFARATMFMGAKLLQNGGIVTMVHDGSAYVTS